MTRRLLAPLVIVALAIAVAAQARVVVDHDADVDFSRFGTFAFRPGTPAENALNQKRLDAAIERELVARGLRRVEEGADLLVVTHEVPEKETHVSVDEFGSRAWRGPRDVDIDVRDVHVRTLIVELRDAAEEGLAWRGLASGVYTPTMRPARVEKRIDKAVSRMFRDYPPD